ADNEADMLAETLALILADIDGEALIEALMLAEILADIDAETPTS
ncbi:unnamed protein product, partial [marine sediment metagenome]